MALGVALVNLAARVVLQTGVVDRKAETVEHVRYGHGARLLAVHADGECLDATQEEETIEGGQSIADGVDQEAELLYKRKYEYVLENLER